MIDFWQNMKFLRYTALTLGIIFSTHSFVQKIDVKTQMSKDFLSCKLDEKIHNFVLDLSYGVEDNKVTFDKTKSTMFVGKDEYIGINGYQSYKTPHSEQYDFAVHFQKNGLNIIKFAIKSYDEDDNEYFGYYTIFQNTQEEVMKALGLETDEYLEVTPQGNTKLMCVIAG